MEIMDEAFTARIKAIVNNYPDSIVEYKVQSAISYSWCMDEDYAVLTDLLETEAVNAARDSISDEAFFDMYKHFIRITGAILKESGIEPFIA